MPTLNVRCFEIRDDGKMLAYVGWGPGEPWTRLWETRHNYESLLFDYLRSLSEPPPLAFVSTKPVYVGAAKSLCRLRQQKLREEGFTLLSARDRSTIDAGYKPRRPVYVVDGFGKEVWFPSVSRAARAAGISTAAMVKKCQSGTGARYA